MTIPSAASAGHLQPILSLFFFCIVSLWGEELSESFYFSSLDHAMGYARPVCA